MSNIDWSRVESTASSSARYYYDRDISFRQEMERELRYRELNIRPNPILREMKEIDLELKELRAEVIEKEPVKEENEPLFFDPKELDI